MSADAKVVGYCRTCGKALDEASARPVAGAIYCEEHVPTAAPEPSPYTAPPYHASPPPLPGSHSNTSPGLAFLLGLIPGVGAVYNGQYAKGLDTTLEKREETLKSLESVKQLLMAWECGPSS